MLQQKPSKMPNNSELHPQRPNLFALFLIFLGVEKNILMGDWSNIGGCSEESLKLGGL